MSERSCDLISKFDTALDRLQVASTSSRKSSTVGSDLIAASNLQENAQTQKLKGIIRSLSTTSSSRPLLYRTRLRSLLQTLRNDYNISVSDAGTTEEDLLWLATGKATIQLYGVILDTLLEQTIPLSESMWYWDDVLGSYVKTGLYMLQTSPLRFFNASRDVLREARSRYRADYGVKDAAEESRKNIVEGWKRFYGLVQDSVRDRSLLRARSTILSPFSLSRTEARQKQEQLKKLREQSATAIGLLVDEGLAFPADHETRPEHVNWKLIVAKSVTILESILHHSKSIEGSIGEYEYSVIETIDNAEATEQPSQLAARLLHIMDNHLPQQESSAKSMALEYGIPPRWIRYWIPGIILLLSGSTLLRVFANRRAVITTWIQEFGQTTIDFWSNWVIEPTRRLIGTIRHDESTELALMSRDSLRSDRDSLERMVVDFAIDNPEGGRALKADEIIAIRSKVKEGDLTPVLRAYEQDMKSPVTRALTGNLVRALLIQIQKTKVDVEVAIGGIDSLLKSQELLFGFVGVAPGILLSYFTLQWVRGILSGRKGTRQGQQKGEAVQILRNIDRILTQCSPTENGMLSYKDHGLLICEVHVLRQRASRILPGRVHREFLEDVDDLLDSRQGIEIQTKVVERIHWAYSKWLR